jgi:hypothetical protein
MVTMNYKRGLRKLCKKVVAMSLETYSQTIFMDWFHTYGDSGSGQEGLNLTFSSSSLEINPNESSRLLRGDYSIKEEFSDIEECVEKGMGESVEIVNKIPFSSIQYKLPQHSLFKEQSRKKREQLRVQNIYTGDTLNSYINSELMSLSSSYFLRENEAAAKIISESVYRTGQLRSVSNQINALASSRDRHHRLTAGYIFKRLVFGDEGVGVYFQKQLFQMMDPKNIRLFQVCQSAFLDILVNIAPYHYGDFNQIVFKMAASEDENVRNLCSFLMVSDLIGVSLNKVPFSRRFKEIITTGLKSLSDSNALNISKTITHAYFSLFNKSISEKNEVSLFKFELLLSLKKGGHHANNKHLIQWVMGNDFELGNASLPVFIRLSKSSRYTSRKLAERFVMNHIQATRPELVFRGQSYLVDFLGSGNQQSVSIGIDCVRGFYKDAPKRFLVFWDQVSQGVNRRNMGTTDLVRFRANQEMNKFYWENIVLFKKQLRL